MSGLTHRTQAHIRAVAGTARLEAAIRAIKQRLGSGYYAHQMASVAAVETERELHDGVVSPNGVDYSQSPPGSGEVFDDGNARLVNLDTYGLTPVINEVTAARDAYPSLDERLDDIESTQASLTVGTSFPESPSAGDRCFRTDIGAGLDFVYTGGKWDPADIAKEYARETLDRILRGVAIAGNGTPTTLTLIRKNADDNKGCFEEPEPWAEQATRIELDEGPFLHVWAYTSGGNVVLDQDSGTAKSADNNVDVQVDGVSDGKWDQTTDATYTITGVAAGVHKFSIEGRGAVGELTYFYSITLPQYDYQAVGVAGDIFEVIAVVDSFVTATSTGRTNLGGTAARGTYGEGVAHRLPLGDGYTDQDFDRGTLDWGGWTAFGSAVSDAILWLPHPKGASAWQNDGVTYPRIEAGATGELDSTAGTRGFRNKAGSVFSTVAMPEMANTREFLLCCAMLVRITTAGAASAFAVGDVALAIGTRWRAGAAASAPWALQWHSNLIGLDLFKLENV